MGNDQVNQRVIPPPLGLMYPIIQKSRGSIRETSLNAFCVAFISLNSYHVNCLGVSWTPGWELKPLFIHYDGSCLCNIENLIICFIYVKALLKHVALSETGNCNYLSNTFSLYDGMFCR